MSIQLTGRAIAARPVLFCPGKTHSAPFGKSLVITHTGLMESSSQAGDDAPSGGAPGGTGRWRDGEGLDHWSGREKLFQKVAACAIINSG